VEEVKFVYPDLGEVSLKKEKCSEREGRRREREENTHCDRFVEEYSRKESLALPVEQ
jgi:hypothetical protein